MVYFSFLINVKISRLSRRMWWLLLTHCIKIIDFNNLEFILWHVLQVSSLLFCSRSSPLKFAILLA